MTVAKQELLNLGKDSILRFYDDWMKGEFNLMKGDGSDEIEIRANNIPVLSEDIYDIYKHWCARQGVKPSPMNRAIDHISKRPGIRKENKRYIINKQQSASTRAIIYPPDCEEIPVGKEGKEKEWLGYRIIDFRNCINAYKGGANDF
jgi:putative DNA primase/helicase